MALPRPTARITHAAKLEFSSKDRSRKPGAGQTAAIEQEEFTPNIQRARARKEPAASFKSVKSRFRFGVDIRNNTSISGIATAGSASQTRCGVQRGYYPATMWPLAKTPSFSKQTLQQPDGRWVSRYDAG
jgi:hypothetical protein